MTNKQKTLEEILNDVVSGLYLSKRQVLAKFILQREKEMKREAWIDGFMATGEGYNGEYCDDKYRNQHDNDSVTREDVAEIYDEEL